MGEEPDLDRIKRLLADVARSVGIPSVDDAEPQRAAPGWPAHAKDPARGGAPAVTDERLVTAVGWMRARDERDRVFGADLFFDPAWNMLLDLYVNERRGSVVSVSSLCIAARVPSTTALRWLTMLEKRGLIGRRADDYDRRRSFLFLTEDGRAKIESTLDRAAESGGKLSFGIANRRNYLDRLLDVRRGERQHGIIGTRPVRCNVIEAAEHGMEQDDAIRVRLRLVALTHYIRIGCVRIGSNRQRRAVGERLRTETRHRTCPSCGGRTTHVLTASLP